MHSSMRARVTLTNNYSLPSGRNLRRSSIFTNYKVQLLVEKHSKMRTFNESIDIHGMTQPRRPWHTTVPWWCHLVSFRVQLLSCLRRASFVMLKYYIFPLLSCRCRANRVSSDKTRKYTIKHQLFTSQFSRPQSRWPSGSRGQEDTLLACEKIPPLGRFVCQQGFSNGYEIGMNHWVV